MSPYFTCERSKGRFKLSDEVCISKKCPFLETVAGQLTCTSNHFKAVKKAIKRRNHEKKVDQAKVNPEIMVAEKIAS